MVGQSSVNNTKVFINSCRYDRIIIKSLGTKEIMGEIFRNLWRRKFRTFLTIVGIAIGIFAFTVMGSMALKFNKMIAGGKQYITGQISITPKGSTYGVGGGTLPLNTLNEIAAIDGVDKVGSLVQLNVKDPDPDEISMSMGQPATIYGMDYNSEFKNRNWETMDVKEGRMVGKGDAEDKITVGVTIATDQKLKVGDNYNIRGQDFEVVGILDKTMTGPDSYVFMSITPARKMLIESNPFMKSLYEQGRLSLEDVNSMAGVSWKDGANSEEVSKAIKDKVGDKVIVMSPDKMGEQIDNASVTFNAIIFGSAILALIVGLFSIVNTMIMSISERTKEIGIKKAIGASPRSIVWEYTFEAGVIGLVGGLVGLGFGYLMIAIVNAQLASKGAEIFLVDINFFIEVVLFAFIIGMVAGIVPAIRASKMKVVDAIREL